MLEEQCKRGATGDSRKNRTATHMFSGAQGARKLSEHLSPLRCSSSTLVLYSSDPRQDWSPEASTPKQGRTGCDTYDIVEPISKGTTDGREEKRKREGPCPKQLKIEAKKRGRNRGRHRDDNAITATGTPSLFREAVPRPYFTLPFRTSHMSKLGRTDLSAQPSIETPIDLAVMS